MTGRIVILDPMQPAAIAKMEEFLPPGFSLSTTKSRETPDQLDGIRRADFVIVADVPVGAELIAAGAGTLRGVQKWGVGYDNIDTSAARAAGVRVMRTTGSNAVAVAETALSMIMALNRNILRGHLGMLDGKWLKGNLGAPSMLTTGKTVGIVGMGYIAKALVKLLRGFDAEILYTKPTPLAAEEEEQLGIRYAGFDDLIARSDIVSLHCVLNDATRGIINRDTLARMKPGAILVNMARGGVVVEDDLADAIESGHLRGAGVDVFATEPPEPGNRLVGLPGVLVTPHIAAGAADTYAATVSRMMANILAVAEGREPPALDVVV